MDDGKLISNAIDAAGRLQLARQSYHDAVLAALDSGVSVSDLARELGISRQAVNQLRLRARTKSLLGKPGTIKLDEH